LQGLVAEATREKKAVTKEKSTMKSTRVMLSLVLLLSIISAAAQTGPQKAQPQTDAEKSFALLKSLAGTWEGPVKMEGHDHGNANGAPESVQVSLRVTSRGNALVHEMGDLNRTDDPTKYDHPVTMFYLDEGKLMLTHFCDAGNRPRMEAKISPDGKTVEFDFAGLSGSDKFGHMYHAVITIIDANHHTEKWVFQLPNGKFMGGEMDLQRVKPQQASAR
jgi:hypothetical protein